MGSGGASRGCTRRGISVNFIRGTSKICSKYLSQLMYSLSLGSCNLLVCGEGKGRRRGRRRKAKGRRRKARGEEKEGEREEKKGEGEKKEGEGEKKGEGEEKEGEGEEGEEGRKKGRGRRKQENRAERKAQSTCTHKT